MPHPTNQNSVLRNTLGDVGFAEIHLQNLPQIFTTPVRQNQFFQQNIFNEAPVPQNPIAMNTNSASTGPYTEIPSWYQQLDLRQIRILRGGQPIVDFDAADKCRLYVMTTKVMNFKDDFPSIPIDNFKHHYVLVFDLTSMHDATEHCRNPDLVGQPLRLELNFTFPLEHATDLIVLGKRKSLVPVDKVGIVGKKIQNKYWVSPANNEAYLATEVSVLWLIYL